LGLNQILIQEAEKAGVLLFFEHECTEVDLNRKQIRFRTPTEEKEVAFQVLFGTDGAGSPVRQSLKKSIPNFKETIETLEYGYKELTIPPTEEGAFRFPENHLHIWPRHSFMMIALPNRDRTFTCTLFLPLEGHFPSFAQLRAGDDVIAFFQETFPDAFPHLLALTKEFFENPTGYLGTVRCGPWHYQGDVLLLGDAAHTIVPFYGQGMNAAFEDCDLLDNLLDSFETWEKLFSHFYHQRKPDAEAIANLALDNFIEMRDQVLNPLFQQRRQIELALEKYYPDQFYSKYRLVTFTSVPYHQAKKQGEAQEEFLQNWIQFHGYPTTEKLSFVLRELKKYLKEKGFINPIPAS
jgi:kynurenine 3-monooxygenase